MTSAPEPSATITTILARDLSTLGTFLVGLATLLGGEQPVTLLVLFFIFAFAGALGRMFWDVDSTLTWRRQIGFVVVTVMTSTGVALLCWEWASHYPGPALGCVALLAVLGPSDLLAYARAITRALVRTLLKEEGPRDVP